MLNMTAPYRCMQQDPVKLWQAMFQPGSCYEWECGLIGRPLCLKRYVDGSMTLSVASEHTPSQLAVYKLQTCLQLQVLKSVQSFCTAKCRELCVL